MKTKTRPRLQIVRKNKYFFRQYDVLEDTTLLELISQKIFAIYSTLPHHSVEITGILSHLIHFWQKFRESNGFTKQVTKELI